MIDPDAWTNPATIYALAKLAEQTKPLVTVAANTLEKLVSPPADGLGISARQWCEFLFSPPADLPPSLSGAIADVFRWNTVATLAAADQTSRVRGVELRPIKPEALVRLLDEARKTSDETLRDAWANLLVSECETAGAAHPMFVNALAQMSGEDARTFAAACLVEQVASATPPRVPCPPEYRARFTVQTGENHVQGQADARYEFLSDPRIERLTALGLVERDGLRLAWFSDGFVPAPIFTPFGRQFASALRLEVSR